MMADDGRPSLDSLVRWHLRTSRRSRHAAAGPAAPPDLSLGLAEGLYMGESAKHQQAALALARKRRRPNQFLVLIYNLLLADIHQAASFLLNAVWLGRGGIHVRTATCWAQAFLIQVGDLASSFFITAIAVHTYLAVVWNYTPPQPAVYGIVVFLWVFNYLLIIIGIAVTKNGKEEGGLFVRATAWCWINIRYEMLRLLLHYLWIFIALAITGILYTLIFLSLNNKRRRAQRSDKLHSAARAGKGPGPTESRTNIHNSDDITATTAAEQILPGVDPGAFGGGGGGGGSEHGREEVADGVGRGGSSGGGGEGGAGHPKVFLLYPLIYIVCTAPLALGRIASMAGVDVPPAYFYTAGALITSNGWLDVLLWGVTRHRLLFGADVDAEDSGLDTFTFMRTPHGRRWGNMVWVEGGGGHRRPAGGAGGGARHGEAEGEAGKLGGLVKRRMGWRPLFGFGGGGGIGGVGGGSHGGNNGCGGGAGQGGEGRRRGAGHDGAELAGREDGLAIQMDMVTTVVVEQAEGKLWERWEPGRSTRHIPSASAGSNNRAYEDLELDDTLLKNLE
ncbi:hypothetical protein MYCTH_2298514 [Thermothelomyces thermophilus ATCC 42464]|uniref:G-protein coupled receptors family 1 profile domain-containing protein n=1 Tax=Thermothelomyces thermophilus (strain ATCC 42464 / BCRC 31852 / DSM 1799) TaxID=573729 RepID=G2Q2G3_THET4|nr:uncharacterized protein MYCTH_2298514 [Thermothelomyces thermophilus ATCC 42464]AEO55088.1 hypothetical protein MYCTH_2298514 [Thermothelomyces thermophilus ATCC 42464]